MTALRYSLLILDFDGTMGDTRSLITDTMAQTIEALGLEKKTRAECAKTIGLPLEKCFTTLFPDMDEEMGQQCAATYRVLFERNNRSGRVKPFPGVLETIRELHTHGATVTIASSRGHRSVQEFVREMGLRDVISYILGGDDVPQAKPAPDPVLLTLDHCRAERKDTLVVGDTKYDVLMGKNAGVAACGVTYGNGTLEELQAAGADFVISHFGSLLNIALG